MGKTCNRTLAAVAVCLVLASLAAAAVIVGGGGQLTGGKPNFQSDKIVTGGGGGTNTHHTYRFAFQANFKVCDINVRMEDESGNEITAGANDGMTQISVQQAQNGGWSEAETKDFANPASKGSIDLQNQIEAETPFRVDVKAKSSMSAIKFSMSFSTKDEGQPGYCYVPEYSGGNTIQAGPIFAGRIGIVLPVKNDTAGDTWTFGRFEIVGEVTNIDSVSAPGTTFQAAIAPDGRSFTLTGGSLAPGQSMSVFVEFLGPTTGRGALLSVMTRS